LYTSPWAGVEPTVAIGIDYRGSCKSNYHDGPCCCGSVSKIWMCEQQIRLLLLGGGTNRITTTTTTRQTG
jgi:hypothetical protein